MVAYTQLTDTVLQHIMISEEKEFVEVALNTTYKHFLHYNVIGQKKTQGN